MRLKQKILKNRYNMYRHFLAPQVGFEPTAYRLTAERSTTELLGNIKLFCDEQYLSLTPL